MISRSLQDEAIDAGDLDEAEAIESAIVQQEVDVADTEAIMEGEEAEDAILEEDLVDIEGGDEQGGT